MIINISGKIQKLNGSYFIFENNSGGKAGIGNNKTASICVAENVYSGFLTIKRIRYIIDLHGFNRDNAIRQAYDFIESIGKLSKVKE